MKNKVFMAAMLLWLAACGYAYAGGLQGVGGSYSGPAASLQTTGATVDVAAGAPGIAGYVLTLTDATHATWQAGGGGGGGYWSRAGGVVSPTTGTDTVTAAGVSVVSSSTGMLMLAQVTPPSTYSANGTIVIADIGGVLKVSANGAPFAQLGFSGGAITGQYYSVQATCTTTLDWNNGNCQVITLANSSQTFTFANGVAGGRYLIRMKSGGASTTVTWPAAVHWAGGVTPTITAVTNQIDIGAFFYDGTNYYGSISQNFAP